MSVPHILNCALLLSLIALSWWKLYVDNYAKSLDQSQQYDWLFVLLYIISCTVFLNLPQSICNFLGLILFQSFPNQPQLKVPTAFV